MGTGSSGDFDLEHLQTSLTLPRIEAVLRAEGIKPQSITQQIDKIRERTKRYVCTEIKFCAGTLGRELVQVYVL